MTKHDADPKAASDFRDALLGFDRRFDLRLSPEELGKLADYYRLVLRWNKLTHLTTITEPSSFAQFHVVESLWGGRLIDPRAGRFWDLGAGLGIPGIPTAVRRPDLGVMLVEAAKKKAIFLKEAADRLGLANVQVINQRFETLPPMPADSAVAARAVDGMQGLLPRILDLASSSRQLLIYGGEDIGRILAAHPFPEFAESLYLLPASTNRYLFVRLRSE
jgi:16S rRNA (guanine(527)-N(7))-methyltransferase RsmG